MQDDCNEDGSENGMKMYGYTVALAIQAKNSPLTMR